MQEPATHVASIAAVAISRPRECVNIVLCVVQFSSRCQHLLRRKLLNLRRYPHRDLSQNSLASVRRLEILLANG